MAAATAELERLKAAIETWHLPCGKDDNSIEHFLWAHPPKGSGREMPKCTCMNEGTHHEHDCPVILWAKVRGLPEWFKIAMSAALCTVSKSHPHTLHENELWRFARALEAEVKQLKDEKRALMEALEVLPKLAVLRQSIESELLSEARGGKK